MESLFLIDRLESLVQKGFKLPFTPLVVLNEDEILGIIDRLRLSLPQEIEEARHIVEERNTILAGAQEEAEKILSRARERALEILSEHEIIKRAEARARTIEEKALKRAQELTQSADQYALEVLQDLEAKLLEFLKVVQNGIKELRSK
ncbi:MAG: ATPase [Anaerolineae bacterium]|nr:ATPase [Anaerolineae bacterium]MDW8101963.1 ATPase [Anaerolineae bacterium]